MNEYGTFKDALANIGRSIKEEYNSKRLHSSIGYKSPVDFEKALYSMEADKSLISIQNNPVFI